MRQPSFRPLEEERQRTGRDNRIGFERVRCSVETEGFLQPRSGRWESPCFEKGNAPNVVLEVRHAATPSAAGLDKVVLERAIRSRRRVWMEVTGPNWFRGPELDQGMMSVPGELARSPAVSNGRMVHDELQGSPGRLGASGVAS